MPIFTSFTNFFKAKLLKAKFAIAKLFNTQLLKIKLITLSLMLCASSGVLAKSISISTSQWQPYINSEHQPLGTAAQLLKQILSQDKHQIEWQYQNYDLAFELVSSGKQEAAFPYFKTKSREQSVLYSAPVFRVTNHIYYNRQKENRLQFESLQQHKFGRVAGYSYGQQIDSYLTDAVSFASESDALESLLKNEIDFLPMTESVMNNMLNNVYRDQAQLIKQVKGVDVQESLHVITSNTEDGKQLISLLNQLLVDVKTIQSLRLKTIERFKAKDIAKLISAEGYPAIVGQTSVDNNSLYYTLPQGTRVLVLSWSDKILKPSSTDRIYKSMIDLSQVVVLNGPHVGKELYIKNMHLEVQ